jgi:hypothetical protein
MPKKTTTKKSSARTATATKPTAAKTSASKPSVLKSPPKYDQPGAPWWKKFPTPSHG